jgi:alkylation response protein AidB-like acyl-CoA dehydrogenase
VSAESITELGELGALNHLAPVECGGLALDRAADRRLHETIAYSCFNTWLVWAQHASIVPRIAALHATGVRHPLAENILTGKTLLGAGISDIRHYPTRYVAAVRTDTGWTFDGTVSWVSGWGLNSAFILAAVEPETERVVLALVPLSERMHATPLGLSVVSGSRTERVRLDKVEIPDEYVLAVQPLEDYRAADRSMSSDARSQLFGLALRILDELREEPQVSAHSLVDYWQPRVLELRERAYALTDEALAGTDGDHRLAERLQIKVAATESVAALSQALLIARSGAGLTGGNTAQLHARSALFCSVQGQTDRVRFAQLARAATPRGVGSIESFADIGQLRNEPDISVLHTQHR